MFVGRRRVRYWREAICAVKAFVTVAAAAGRGAAQTVAIEQIVIFPAFQTLLLLLMTLKAIDNIRALNASFPLRKIAGAAFGTSLFIGFTDFTISEIGARLADVIVQKIPNFAGHAGRFVKI